MNRWWDVFCRELSMLFRRDPRRIAFLCGASLAYILLFGLLYDTHVVKPIPLVIYNEDQSALSRRLVEGFEDSERYRVVAEVTSQEAMEAILHNKEALVALAIPSNMAKDVRLGRGTQLLVDVNGANIAVANAVVSSAQEIILQFSGAVGTGMVESIGQLPNLAVHKVAPVDFRLRVLNNPTLSYQNFFVVGLGMTALQQGILLAVGAGFAGFLWRREEWNGLSAWQLLTAKLLPYWLCALLALVLSVALAVYGFGIPLRGSFSQLAPLGAAFCLATACLGVLLACFCRDEVVFTQWALVYAVPSFILSGYTWPLLAMEPISRAIAACIPLTYFADDVRSIFLAGYSPQASSHSLLLLGFALLFFSAAWLRCRWPQRASSKTDQPTLPA